MAAVKKEMVDERLKLFKEAGLELSRVTINSIATANAFSRLGPQVTASGKAKAVLDIGRSASCLMIFKDSSLRFARDIFVGSQELTKKIANALGVDVQQAEAIKRQPGDKLAQVIEACDMPINNLISEIRLSVDYFMTEKNIQVDELFLGGGGSLLKGMEGVFEKNLGLPVKIWNPLVRVRLNATGGIRGHSNLCRTVWCGLRFGALDMIDINLIPAALRKNGKENAFPDDQYPPGDPFWCGGRIDFPYRDGPFAFGGGMVDGYGAFGQLYGKLAEGIA